jgi:hypothetical protein
VPCSRSRMRAAPVRMIDSMVIWLMICDRLPNQLLSSVGLNLPALRDPRARDEPR